MLWKNRFKDFLFIYVLLKNKKNCFQGFPTFHLRHEQRKWNLVSGGNDVPSQGDFSLIVCLGKLLCIVTLGGVFSINNIPSPWRYGLQSSWSGKAKGTYCKYFIDCINLIHLLFPFFLFILNDLVVSKACQCHVNFLLNVILFAVDFK